jgi:NDP-sugar pyrophosphorylase family protein
VIKEYSPIYLLHSADVTTDLQANRVEMHKNECEPWRVTLIDTGAGTMTGGRLRRILPYVKDEELFCFTYGDGCGQVRAFRWAVHEIDGHDYQQLADTLDVVPFEKGKPSIVVAHTIEGKGIRFMEDLLA